MIRRFINKVFGRKPRGAASAAQILTQSKHGIRRDQLDDCALKTCETLAQAGYKGYLVGGAVRDLLLGKTPKDFDVATDATPEEVRRLFRRSRIIGRRFQIVHVMCGRVTIEVTTFRANGQKEADEEDERPTDEHGRLLSDNVFGNMADDAARRDFTINALYYDPTSERILDHTHGVHDIRNRLIRLIGDPEQRYLEDPVRMLRAIRFAAKLDFEIEKHSAEPIPDLADLLCDVPSARLFDEILKLFLGGKALRTFELLVEYDLFAPLFPASAEALEDNPEYAGTLIRNALANTDQRIAEGKPVTPAFLFAALLWPALPARVLEAQERGLPPIPAMQEAAHDLVWEQCQRTAIPKRFTLPMREIWDMQERLPRRQGRRADQLLDNPRFRAGYDFLLLRESAGEQTDGLGDWWTEYQDVSDSERRNMIRDLSKRGDDSGAPRKRRRSGGRRKRGPTEGAPTTNE